MQSGRYAGRIEASRQEAERLGVGGTPAFFVDGRHLQGGGVPNSDEIKRLVDQALAGRAPRR
jgi:protein-disulfide isomerase